MLKNNIRKKLLKYLLIGGGIILIFLFINTPIIKMPLNWSDMMAGIKAEPTYIPIKYNKSYMTNISCGKSCDILKLHYEATKEQIIVTSTNKVSWADDLKWNKKTKITGRIA